MNKWVDVRINISSVVEFQRWWVLKNKIFSQESTYSKGKKFKNSGDEWQFVKSAKIVLSKSIFDVKNQRNFQILFFSLKNVNLGDHFLLNSDG